MLIEVVCRTRIQRLRIVDGIAIRNGALAEVGRKLDEAGGVAKRAGY